jgi:hypothetical protein
MTCRSSLPRNYWIVPRSCAAHPLHCALPLLCTASAPVRDEQQPGECVGRRAVAGHTLTDRAETLFQLKVLRSPHHAPGAR